eukprot:scaffold283_cov316-Pavlova_lutheri.AAC.49
MPQAAPEHRFAFCNGGGRARPWAPRLGDRITRAEAEGRDRRRTALAKSFRLPIGPLPKTSKRLRIRSPDRDSPCRSCASPRTLDGEREQTAFRRVNAEP